MFEQKTHNLASEKLIGKVMEIKDGFARVVLETDESMKVDEKNLVHGGFTFGLADYAAMVCVNHPYVVLGSADVKFLAPVKAGETLEAKAFHISGESKKHIVEVEIFSNSKKVFSGIFKCYILEKHVLD